MIQFIICCSLTRSIKTEEGRWAQQPKLCGKNDSKDGEYTSNIVLMLCDSYQNTERNYEFNSDNGEYAALYKFNLLYRF